MKRMTLYIRPREDGKYWIQSEWGFGWIIHKKTGLTEDELINEVIAQIKGTIEQWNKK